MPDGDQTVTKGKDLVDEAPEVVPVVNDEGVDAGLVGKDSLDIAGVPCRDPLLRVLGRLRRSHERECVRSKARSALARSG